jgi:hypothetical protein
MPAKKPSENRARGKNSSRAWGATNRLTLYGRRIEPAPTLL